MVCRASMGPNASLVALMSNPQVHSVGIWIEWWTETQRLLEALHLLAVQCRQHDGGCWLP
jgi:hypothetical protein